jgi:hypothetical protein
MTFKAKLICSADVKHFKLKALQYLKSIYLTKQWKRTDNGKKIVKNTSVN